MKRAFLFMTCLMASLAMSAEGSDTYFDYIPFVKEGKAWHVVSFSSDRSCRFTQYKLTNEKVVKNGKTYIKMDLNSDGMIVYDAALLREENRKVYRFDPDLQKEVLLFDYSLKAGDTYEAYSFDAMKERSYKVLSVDDCLEGPKIVRYVESADSMTTQYRYLRKWTVCLTGNSSLQKTWIEGVGSLNGPFDNLYDMSPGYSQYLAYTIDDDYVNSNSYLPFPLYDKSHQAHGCNLPTGEADPSDWRHQLTYELEGDRLHVYGKAYTQCGPNNYAYFIEKPTDDPLVHKIEFVIQDVNPVANCMSLHKTNFYVSGFDPNMNYIVVDNQGVEHPVVNRTPQNAYRPFIEEGKVWKVGSTLIRDNLVKMVEYYYFDGDTVINNKTCKRMMCQRYVNPEYPDYAIVMHYPMLRYVGAWYEEDQKVYFATNNQVKLLYDFSADANDTIEISNNSYVVGAKQTGGVKGFKGVYRDILMGNYNTTWLEGVGGIDGPTVSVYSGEENHAIFLMSCTVGDEVIYFNDDYEDGATPESAEARKRIDFTHTIKIKPKSRRTIDVESLLYGEYNDLQLGINLDPLDDAYLVRIADETGKTVYEKAVNAGNIVGLNIDISAYAEGRYTITVENSNETFTGRFETQPTGIKEAKSKCLETKGAIYDLLGRRLAAPPAKGVYIQDGRKVLK